MDIQNNTYFIKSIEKYGKVYYLKNLQQFSIEKLQNDWWNAIEFFFGRSFYRGRKDELSNDYYHFAIDVLKNEFKINQVSREESYKILKENKRYFDKSTILKFRNKYKLGKSLKINNDFTYFKHEVSNKNKIIEKLTTEKKVIVKWNEKEEQKNLKLGNPEDIMMVLDALDLVSDVGNIYTYLFNMIKKDGIEPAYERLDKIWSIGDKIASFILRDILIINQMEKGSSFKLPIKKTSYPKAFPVDTWVNKIAIKIGCNNEKLSSIKECLIDKCLASDSNPLLVAAGLWYLGFNSLDILLEGYFTVNQ